MIKNMTKLTGWTASLVALAATASADVKINDYLSLNGFATASGTYSDNTAGAKNVSTLFNSGINELDGVKLAAVGTYGDFGGKVSVLYIPKKAGGDSSGIQDAYATYTKDGFTVTGGKFLSYLGYEAFDPNNMVQLTYGADIFAIPGYHTGAKVDYAAKTWGAGVAITDSVYMTGGNGFLQGDGDFSQTGEEAYFTYTGIDKLTLWFGAAYEQNDDVTYDAWASYALTSKLTLAAEVDSQESIGKGWLTEVQYAFSDKFSGIVRVSGKSVDGGDEGTYFTVAPSYKVFSNLTIRGEVSYADAAEATNGAYGLLSTKGTFYGVQALFTF